jgi:hypothetical protein
MNDLIFKPDSNSIYPRTSASLSVIIASIENAKPGVGCNVVGKPGASHNVASNLNNGIRESNKILSPRPGLRISYKKPKKAKKRSSSYAHERGHLFIH